MSNRKRERVTEEIGHLASKYLARELGVRALVTVTRTEMTPDLKKAIVFISVLPESKEDEAIRLAKRARSGFRAHLIEHSKIRPVPLVDIVIDEGEKNRRRIDDLTRKKNQ